MRLSHLLQRSIQLSMLAIACVGIQLQLRADVLVLASGGRLEGKIDQLADADKANFTIELAAGGRVTIPRSQVTRVDTTSAAEAEYQKLSHSSPDTVAEHEKLAEWCRQHKLSDEYQRHLERILELNPSHVEARTALGFRQKNGKWLKREDLMADRGLVNYKGRYITPQQVEIMEAQEKARVTQADWNSRIKQLRNWITGRRPEKVAQALAEVKAIKDPQAADSIAAALRNESNLELKRLWIEVAGQLQSSRPAVDALVHVSLADPNEDFRQLALDLLIKSGRPALATPYVRALTNKDNEIVNRAGVALGRIRDRDTIGPLIDALITTHKVKVGEGNPDQHAYSFSSDGSAFNFGGSGGPKIISQALRNRSVLDALITMSGGTTFDYDQDQWRGWLAAQAKVNAVDVRRDQ